MIEGLIITPLNKIQDERGSVMLMLRQDAPHFKSFGEVYFSTIKPMAIKAWKRHQKMIQNFTVPQGEVLLVVYDDRQDSSTRGQLAQITLGENNYQLVTLPPTLWYGFQGISQTQALLVNCASLPHDPSESETTPVVNANIPYCWQRLEL